MNRPIRLDVDPSTFSRLTVPLATSDYPEFCRAQRKYWEQHLNTATATERPNAERCLQAARELEAALS